MKALHQAGDVINQKYKIVDIIGQGSSGITYSAIALATKIEVAIKALSLQGVNDWKQIELFEREAKILANLDHRCIPQYIDYFCLDCNDSRNFYIVQQLAPGKSLFQLVRDGWRTNEAEIKSIAKQILEILIYLHGLVPPVVHRDIKPQNLIRSDEGKIFLVDFGAVQNTYYTNFKQGSTVVGTYGYMAPEQFRGQATPATDLYSLGATLVYLLTHCSPAELPHNNLKINFRERVNISNQFATWLDKILEPNLAARFTSADEALTDLCSSTFEAREYLKKLFNTKLSLVAASLVASISLGTVGLFYYLQPEDNTVAELEKNPRQICQSLEIAKYYLEKGGNPNLTVSYQSDRNIIQESSLLFCLLKTAGEKDTELFKTIELLIDLEADINTKTNNGETPLLWLLSNNRSGYNYRGLSKNQRTQIANLLIDRGADIDLRNSQTYSPLLLALSYGYPEVAEKLIAKGANINFTTQDNITPLMRALSNNHTEIARELIARGAKINVQNNRNQTPLSIAVAKNNLEMIKLLIAKGADVKTVDRNGNTLLFQAGAIGDLNTIETLVNAGIDVNRRNNQNQTALFEVFKNTRYQQVQEITEFLMVKGAEINIKDNQGINILFMAVSSRNIPYSVIKLLLDKGVEIDVQNSRGETPLLRAIAYKNWQVAQLLIDRGANVNIRSMDYRQTPLSMAVGENNLEMIELLIAKKADVNFKDSRGNTPLMTAVYSRNRNGLKLEIIQLLIANGADVNGKNSNNETVLSLFVDKINRNTNINNYLEFVELLIANGADVNHKDNDGRSILLKAAYSGNEELVALLQKHGAKY